MPDEFKGKFAVSPASDQGICNAVTPVGVAFGETAATHQFGFKDDYIPHHEPFQYYASTANPHHLPPSGLSAIGTDTQHSVGGAPQFDTANHQYDTSDFEPIRHRGSAARARRPRRRSVGSRAATASARVSRCR
jgi:phospholipase C